ncbi:MAG: hypothetical protein ABSF16_12125 [Terracidiphilus sp.]|jgi:hypothetical protein
MAKAAKKHRSLLDVIRQSSPAIPNIFIRIAGIYVVLWLLLKYYSSKAQMQTIKQAKFLPLITPGGK